jgi:hypothetical protein
MGIRRRSEFGGAAAKDFRVRVQLDVNLEADYGFELFVRHGMFAPPSL